MKIYLSDARSYESFSKNQSTPFSLTLLPEARLSQRLCAEMDFAIQQIKNHWPKFKEDPFGSVRLAVRHLVASATRTIARPQMAFALITSVLILTSAIVAVLVLERRGYTHRGDDDSEFGVVTTLKFTSSSETQKSQGIGAGEKGRVGFARDSGEGSRPQPARSHGGGGGGDGSQLAASRGRVPVTSVIPAPIPTAAVHLPQALPVAGIDLDPALYRRLDYSAYGDPRSKQTTSSNGSGSGGGIGNGNGTGIGEGDGAGFGPGRDGNIEIGRAHV